MDRTNQTWCKQYKVEFNEIVKELSLKIGLEKEELDRILYLFCEYFIEKLCSNDELRFRQFTFKICRESLLVEGKKRFDEQKNGTIINNHDILFLRMNPKKGKHFVPTEKMKIILQRLDEVGYKFELNPYKYVN